MYAYGVQSGMRIKSVVHRGLKRFIEKNDSKSLPSAKVDKIRDIITALIVAESMGDLPAFPGWRLHKLKGDRKDQWSISVTGNWRITFEERDDEIYDLKLEDYH